jgi:hypothetical protein
MNGEALNYRVAYRDPDLRAEQAQAALRSGQARVLLIGQNVMVDKGGGTSGAN